MPVDLDSIETTQDAVLGGRLQLRQPKRGHRVGHDAILLAAATAAQAGDVVVDLGAGVGGAGLALAARVAGVAVTLVEIDPSLCALAAFNAGLNRMDGRVRAVVADAGDSASLAAAGLGQASADGVLMNPPFNDPRRQSSSPQASRRLAHVADDGLLPRWLAAANWLLKPGGTVTLIWRAEALDAVLAALTSAFGDVVVMPVLPRPGASAIRVLARAEKSGSGPRRDLPALILNDIENRPSAEAEAVLRAAEPLALARRA
ncbi:MAG: methyltransferase [Rhodopseudomonas sp.]|nr:methyltransferase [Rhodopseudomonas sp.]